MKSFQFNKKLSKSFYKEDPIVLAPKILSKIIVRKTEQNIYAGKIVEVEAYRGEDDPSAHSFNGKTKRNEVMFYEGGFLYVYFTYGMHFCANIVTGNLGEGCAILIRGVEPLKSLEQMALNRFGNSSLNKKIIGNLTNGPAKFCQAFNIDKSNNGTDLTSDSIFLLDAPKIENKNIIKTTRIGIKKAADYPWRFYIKDNPFVSKK